MLHIDCMLAVLELFDIIADYYYTIKIVNNVYLNMQITWATIKVSDSESTASITTIISIE